MKETLKAFGLRTLPGCPPHEGTTAWSEFSDNRPLGFEAPALAPLGHGRSRSVEIGGLLLLLAARSTAPAADKDFASRALSVLHAKCGACHGSSVNKPESDFGHVDDLARLARDGQLIVPGKPEESRLFRRMAIEHDMPPKGLAKKLGITPPTPEEISVVREWIAAGAPPPAPKVAQKQ